MNQDDLQAKIEQLSELEVAETLKNLRIALQHQQQRQLSDDEVRRDLQGVETPGATGALRDAILSDANAPPREIERWGKGLLHCLAADPDLLPTIEQSIEDAQLSSSKDFGLTTLIVLGVIVVLLKYRPTTIKTGKSGTTIQWRENDVSIVRSLIQGVSGMSTNG
jgi:hypothetical protein